MVHFTPMWLFNQSIFDVVHLIRTEQLLLRRLKMTLVFWNYQVAYFTARIAVLLFFLFPSTSNVIATSDGRFGKNKTTWWKTVVGLGNNTPPSFVCDHCEYFLGTALRWMTMNTIGLHYICGIVVSVETYIPTCLLLRHQVWLGI